MSVKAKRTALEIFSILLLGTFSLLWFQPDKFINSSDSLIPVRLSAFIGEYFYLWSQKTALGILDIMKLPFLMPVGFLLKLYAATGLPFSPIFYEKIMTYVLFAGAGLSGYLLYRTLFRDSTTIGRLLAAIFYMFNFYVFFIFFPLPLSLLTSYCFFPAVFATLVKLVHKKTVFNAVVFAGLWTIALTPSYATPPYLILHVAVFAFYILFRLLVCHETQKKRLFGLLTLSGVIFLGLHVYWLLPQVFNLQKELSSYSTLDISPESITKLNAVSIFDGFRFMGYFGFGSGFEGSLFYPWFGIYTTPMFTFLSYVLPLLAFSGLLLKHKSRTYYFILFLGLLFIFLVKGPNDPFGFINTFVFDKLQLNTLFRTGYQRFTGFVALFLALAAAYSVDNFLGVANLTKTVKKLTGFLFYATVLVSLVGVFAFPLWRGDLFESEGIIPSLRVRIPEDYIKASDWLTNNQSVFNVFPFPFSYYGGLGSFWWNGGKDGYLGVYPLNMMTDKGFFTFVDNNPAGSVAKAIAGRMKEVPIYMGFLNTRYVLFHKDSNWRFVKAHPWWISADPVETENWLDNLQGLTLAGEFNGLKFYEVSNKYFLQRVYIPKTVYQLDSDSNTYNFQVDSRTYQSQSAFVPGPIFTQLQQQVPSSLSLGDQVPTVEFRKVNPTKYRIRIHHAQGAFPLILSELFSQWWDLHLVPYSGTTISPNDISSQPSNIGKSLANPSEATSENAAATDFISDQINGSIQNNNLPTGFLTETWFRQPSFDSLSHFRINAFANSWIVDPSRVCRDSTCQANKDGTYNLELVAEFWPQKLFYIGLGVSIFFSVMVGLYFIVMFAERSVKKQQEDRVFVKSRPNELPDTLPSPIIFESPDVEKPRARERYLATLAILLLVMTIIFPEIPAPVRVSNTVALLILICFLINFRGVAASLQKLKVDTTSLPLNLISNIAAAFLSFVLTVYVIDHIDPLAVSAQVLFGFVACLLFVKIWKVSNRSLAFVGILLMITAIIHYIERRALVTLVYSGGAFLTFAYLVSAELVHKYLEPQGGNYQV